MHPNLVSLASAATDRAGLDYAIVSGRAGHWYLLQGATERALRADSCLLEPQAGDSVLVCSSGSHAPAFILAVLSSLQRASATVVLPGGATLTTDDGHLRIAARQVELAGRETVSLQGPALAVETLTAQLNCQRLTTSAQEVEARFGSVTMLASTVTSTVQRLVQRARDSFRWTDNIDETRAGRLRIKVAERFHLSARHASVVAEGQVKIDARKIDLG